MITEYLEITCMKLSGYAWNWLYLNVIELINCLRQWLIEIDDEYEGFEYMLCWRIVEFDSNCMFVHCLYSMGVLVLVGMDLCNDLRELG